MSVDSHLLALRTLFDPAAADGFTATLELRLGEDRVRVDVADGRLEVARGEAPSADAIIETDAPTLLALARGRRTLAAAQRAGDVAIQGAQAIAARFLGLFPLPSLFSPWRGAIGTDLPPAVRISEMIVRMLRERPTRRRGAARGPRASRSAYDH